LNFLRPKIKQIFQRVLAGIFHPKLVLGVVLFLFVFVYCFSHTNTVKAEDYDYSKFKLSTAININGTPGNFIKVVSGQPINLQATIKIDAPDAGIILNGDTRIDFRWVKGVGTAAAQIKEVGLGVESVYEESKDCSQMSNWSGENYVACSFDTAKYVIAKNQLTDGKTIPAGKEFAFNITLDSSKLEKLGLLKHKDSSNVGSFTIQPYFLLDFPYSIDFEGSTFLTKPNNVVFVGKEVYVQFFSTQAELTASGDNKPNTVPNYGSITSGVQETQIRGIPKLINDLFTAAAQFVISGIFSIFTTLIAPMLTGVLSVRVYTDAFVNVIYPGWEVLRNVVNIYFIVAIIAIALATLFRVESYKFRPLLIKLIIAALIVNFSLVVCQVILAVADTLQSQFLPNNAEVIGALAKDLMPAQIADIIRSNQLVTNSVFSTAITTLFFMSMAIGGFLVFVAILGYLFIRIVMIWIFLILSPLAFAADVLPSTSGMGQKWWGDFIKYAFFTPVMAFFLNMAAVIAVNYESIFGSISTNLVYGSTNSGKFTVLILATASNILLLVFLFGAINIAQQFSIFGANVVDGVFKTGVFAPFVGAGGVVALGGKGVQWLGKDVAGGWIQKQYNNRTAKLAEGQSKFKKALYAGLHIPSTVKAFRKDASEELQRSKDLTSAAALSVKRQTPGFKRKGEDPLALYNEHKGKELLEERRGESTDTEEDEVVFGLQLADEAMAGDKDAQLMLPEQLRRMAKNHNLNEFLERYGVKHFGADPKKRDFKYTRENIIGMLHDMETKGAMSEHINTDLQKRLGKFGYQERDYTLAELTYNHHGHAKAIDVEFDQATKSFVVKGKSIYDRIHNLAQDNSTTQEEYDAIVSREVQNLSHSDHELYENASKYEEKIMEALINLKKRDDIDQVKQWWESVVSKKVMPDGSVKPVLAMSGLHLIRNFGAGHEFYASRGNISTKILELLLPLIKDKEHFRSEVEKAIITDAQVTGRKVYDLELEKDKLEYQALRVAAVAEKDTSLVGLEAYDIAIPDPQDPKKKIAIRASFTQSTKE
jgi:hypothetical protein